MRCRPCETFFESLAPGLVGTKLEKSAAIGLRATNLVAFAVVAFSGGVMLSAGAALAGLVWLAPLVFPLGVIGAILLYSKVHDSLFHSDRLRKRALRRGRRRFLRERPHRRLLPTPKPSTGVRH